jgi:hypothetical protein
MRSVLFLLEKRVKDMQLNGERKYNVLYRGIPKQSEYEN